MCLKQPGAETAVPESPSLDPFLTLVYNLLEKHLDDSAFGAEALVTALDLNRMSVYRKLKALTGMSSAEFIRGYRLKQACGYLQEGISITETAYRVGFESPAYFAKCFRDAYQMTPTEFARSKTVL